LNTEAGATSASTGGDGGGCGTGDVCEVADLFAVVVTGRPGGDRGDEALEGHVETTVDALTDHAATRHSAGCRWRRDEGGAQALINRQLDAIARCADVANVSPHTPPCEG
jgi:predicted RecA/RadA family phage recombinase